MCPGPSVGCSACDDERDLARLRAEGRVELRALPCLQSGQLGDRPLVQLDLAVQGVDQGVALLDELVELLRVGRDHGLGDVPAGTGLQQLLRVEGSPVRLAEGGQRVAELTFLRVAALVDHLLLEVDLGDPILQVLEVLGDLLDVGLAGLDRIAEVVLPLELSQLPEGATDQVVELPGHVIRVADAELGGRTGVGHPTGQHGQHPHEGVDGLVGEGDGHPEAELAADAGLEHVQNTCVTQLGHHLVGDSCDAVRHVEGHLVRAVGGDHNGVVGHESYLSYCSCGPGEGPWVHDTSTVAANACRPRCLASCIFAILSVNV